jgi:nucleoside-diphosphate-sugar epimerase
MWEYAQAIKNVFPKADITIKEDPKAALVNDTCVDNSLAMKEIGYSPDFTLEEGIEDHVKTLWKRP